MAEKSTAGPRVSATGPADAFDSSPLDLGANDEAPPAYGELHNQLNLSQAGFNADAAVMNDGRISISINQTSGTLADLLGPALTRSQLMPPQSVPSEPLPPAYVPPSLGGQPGQTPPPKLNVVIQIVGSRGDVQPFVALGKVLKETYGHRVRVATHAVFQSFVEENGLEFFAIGGDPAELMAFMVKHPGLMPGFDAVKSGEIAKRRRGIEQIILGCWRSCVEAGDGLGPPPEPHQSGEPLSTFTSGDFSLPGQPGDKPFVADAIIANPPSFAHIHIAEKMGIPLHIMFTMPWSPTKAFPHPLANIESSNAEDAMTNYVSYALVEMMTWQGLGDVINRFRTKVLDLEPMSLIWAPGLLTRLHIPTTYCWSPALIPKPRDWGCEVNISGFYFLDLATSYTPDPDLAAFLDAGPPPVYIGFGSIVVDDPNKLTRMIFDAITLAGVRALVSKGWGGLGADSVGIPDGVFMLGNCPHDWLFKRVSCVVHHGGAGTTAAGIKTGTPTVIVPFFGDQPFWGSMIAQAGAGPKPIRYADLTAESLAESITTALKPDTQARAKELGERIRAERGTDQGAKSFHDFLDYEKLRCSLSPSRIAVWRVRRTQVRLSALAAAVLVKEGMLQYTDLKLYRSQEYDTEEQPWDPVTAVTSSLVGDVGTMALAIQDIPSNWIKMAKKTTPGPDTPTSAEGKETARSSASFDGGSRTTIETRPSQVNTTDSDAASVSTTATAAPAVILSPPGSAKGNRPSFRSRKSTQSIFNSRSRSKSPMPPTDSQPSSPTPSQSPSSFNIEAALGASIETGKGVQRIVGTGMKTPMNFCMGLAKGFRNAPRLYNDQTVRKQEKVTGLASGVMVAGKEFGLGLFDGITGLVTQPLQGAEKEGAKGLIKGIGKGIGGIVLKPSAGFWAVPAYVMKGLHAEVRGKFHKSVENYIIVSRILQGQDDLRNSNGPEQRDIIMRFNVLDDKLKGFRHLKAKAAKQSAAQSSDSTSSSATATAADNSVVDDDILLPDAPPKTGFRATRHLSFTERKKLHAQKDAWKKGKAAAGASGTTSPATSQQPEPQFRDEELERAIQESVMQTSRGNEAEDALIESQIRVGVVEMRRIAEEKAQQRQRQIEEDEKLMRDFKVNPFANSSSSGGSAEKPLATPPALPARQQPVSSLAQSKAQEAGVTDAGDGDGDEIVDDSITDEEFEELVAEAVRRSIAAQGGLGGPEGYDVGKQQPGDDNDEDDENLRRALEESLRGVDKVDSPAFTAAASGQQGHHLPQQQGYEQGNDTSYDNNDDDDDDENNEELKKALEESERAHREHLARRSTERSEEEIIMEYVKKQSLAEEEFRLQMAAREGQGGENGEKRNESKNDEDEELRKAMEESLQMSGKGGGPSGEKK